MKELYGITDEDIEETRSWEEGRISIDIEKQLLDFNVIDTYTVNELKENYNEEEIEELNIKEINIKFNAIPFEDAFELKGFIDKANYKDKFYFYDKNNKKYVFLKQ